MQISIINRCLLRNYLESVPKVSKFLKFFNTLTNNVLLICSANQLTGFYMGWILVVKVLSFEV